MFDDTFETDFFEIALNLLMNSQVLSKLIPSLKRYLALLIKDTSFSDRAVVQSRNYRHFNLLIPTARHKITREL